MYHFVCHQAVIAKTEDDLQRALYIVNINYKAISLKFLLLKTSWY
jgi:hypothetical protein